MVPASNNAAPQNQAPIDMPEFNQGENLVGEASAHCHSQARSWADHNFNGDWEEWAKDYMVMYRMCESSSRSRQLL